MVQLRAVVVAVTAAALGVATIETLTGAFLSPGSGRTGLPQRVSHAGATRGEGSSEQGGIGGVPWGAAAAGLALGAHVGLLCAKRQGGRSAVKAAETAAEQRLFESVYLDYTSEYLKGPMYFHEDKLQGFLPDYPGNPMFKNGKMTSNATGNLKTFSSNELAFLSVLFLAIGLYGNIQFNYTDPQWVKVDNGENFNVSYIVESLFLPISFFMHIAAYIQKQNGK